MAKTSFLVAGWNDDRGGTDLSVMTGGGAAAVDSRILFTLLWKVSKFTSGLAWLTRSAAVPAVLDQRV